MAQIGSRKIKIDIARKPIDGCDERHELFAPSWDLLMAYKNGCITWDVYKKRYTEEMRSAYVENKREFHDMADRLDHIEFCCWCNKKRVKDDRCHRFLLLDILNKIKA